MTVFLAPAALASSTARSTAAVAPEMTICSGELRLAGETMEWATAARGLSDSEGVVSAGAGAASSSAASAQRSLTWSAGRPRMAAMAPSPAGTACCMKLAAGAHGAEGFGEGDGSGGDVGAVFAERVAGGEGGGEVREELGEDAPGGDGDGEDGGLGVLGVLEGFGGAVEDEVGEGEAEGLVGLVEDGAGGGVGVVELAAHADGLGTLAGEEEGWFGGGVHRVDGK